MRVVGEIFTLDHQQLCNWIRPTVFIQNLNLL